MRTMFDYFTPRRVTGEPITLQDRCLGAMRVVASLWMAAGLVSYNLFHPSVSPETHETLRFMSLICVFISGAMYSVLVPLSRILSEKKD